MVRGDLGYTDCDRQGGWWMMEGVTNVTFPPTGPPDWTKWQARVSRGQTIRRGKGICSGEGRPAVRLQQVPPEVHFRAGNATSCWIAQTPSAQVTAPPPPGSQLPCLKPQAARTCTTHSTNTTAPNRRASGINAP